MNLQIILEQVQELGLVGGMLLVWFASGPLASKWLRTLHTLSGYGLTVAVGIYGYLWFVG